MLRRLFLIGSAMMIMILSACGSTNSQGNAAETSTSVPKVLIAEPLRGFSYLPLYIAIEEEFFDGIEVETTTLSGGSAHTNAVLTNEAWGFIGGPEHNAFAKAKNADLKAIVNVVNRGNNYIVAKSGLKVEGDMATFLKGKTVVTNPYGSTPNSITRFLLAEWGLDVDKDVTFLEVDQSSILSVLSEGEGEIAVVSDPVLQEGINEGIWGEPIYSVPEELGDYAYSTVNVQLETIEDHPEQVTAFVEGLQKGLAYINENPEAALETAKEEFTTVDEDLLEVMLKRALEDKHWQYSGEISEDSIYTNLKVVENADMLEADTITYEDIVDSSFINN